MGPMTPDYGKKIASAFEAVYQLFKDTGKLLQDCDGFIGKVRPSVFGNVITEKLARGMYECDWWMVADAIRYYDASDRCRGVVEGVTVYFWDTPPLHDEPLLILGQVQYQGDSDLTVKSLCQWWDLWSAWFKWTAERRLREVLTLKDVGDGRI